MRSNPPRRLPPSPAQPTHRTGHGDDQNPRLYTPAEAAALLRARNPGYAAAPAAGRRGHLQPRHRTHDQQPHRCTTAPLGNHSIRRPRHGRPPAAPCRLTGRTGRGRSHQARAHRLPYLSRSPRPSSPATMRSSCTPEMSQSRGSVSGADLALCQRAPVAPRRSTLSPPARAGTSWRRRRRSRWDSCWWMRYPRDAGDRATVCSAWSL